MSKVAARAEPGSYQRFYEAVAAAVRSGGPPPMDPEDAAAALDVIEAARLGGARPDRRAPRLTCERGARMDRASDPSAFPMVSGTMAASAPIRRRDPRAVRGSRRKPGIARIPRAPPAPPAPPAPAAPPAPRPRPKIATALRASGPGAFV